MEAKAFYGVEPYGCVADDHRAALIALVVAQGNYVRGRKPRFKDYLFEWGGKVFAKKRSGDSLFKKFKALVGGKQSPGD